jgi:hypothetical protein
MRKFAAGFRRIFRRCGMSTYIAFGVLLGRPARVLGSLRQAQELGGIDMRIATLVLALATACGASPALAQARILTAQDQTQTPPTAPTQAPVPAPAATPAPAQAQEPLQGQAEQQSGSQGESQAKRQDRAPPGVPTRYSFTRVDNGLLRLDHDSGDVAYCTPHNAGWSCEGVPQQGASLEQQIAALRDEVDALRKEVAALRAPPPPPHPVPPQTVPPTPRPDQTGSITIPLPSREDIARARGFIADTWHRLVDMIDNLQKDIMRKGDDTSGVSRT